MIDKQQTEQILTACADAADAYRAVQDFLDENEPSLLDLFLSGASHGFLRRASLRELTERMAAAEAALTELRAAVEGSTFSLPEFPESEEEDERIALIIDALDAFYITVRDAYMEAFPDEENEFTEIELPEVICPRCRSLHTLADECPECGLVYDENITPIFKM